jgi:NADH-quinone oxidoreductase subunit J
MLVLMFIILALMVIFCVVAVMLRNLVKSAISLAVASSMLTVILFMLGVPWAALFELSVCAGLITVIFVSAVSLTTPYSKEEEKEIVKERRKRYMQLPIILVFVAIIVGVALIMGNSTDLVPAVGNASTFISFADVLWNMRQTDILGQIIVILAGVFAIVVLFKERDKR